jgi:hypothetical protein
MILSLHYLPKTYAALNALARPNRGDQPESLPWVFFDTQSYLAAGSARLTYFGNAGQTDLTMSNLGNGTFETDQYFELQRSFMSFLAPLSITTTAAVTGSANDVDILHKAARGMVTFSMLNKAVGPFPIDFFGRPGGINFQGTSEGTETAPARNIIQSAETIMNGGFPFVGAIVIPPVTAFRVFADFNSTAISGNMNIRHAMLGVFHRRVS